jgi:hypothetical protein
MWVLVVATIHLFFEHMIKILIHVIVLEWRPYLLVALVSLLPLSDLRNLTTSDVLIPGLGVMLFLGNSYIPHENFRH